MGAMLGRTAWRTELAQAWDQPTLSPFGLAWFASLSPILVSGVPGSWAVFVATVAAVAAFAAVAALVAVAAVAVVAVVAAVAAVAAAAAVSAVDAAVVVTARTAGGLVATTCTWFSGSVLGGGGHPKACPGTGVVAMVSK